MGFQGSGFRVSGFGLRIDDSGLMVQGTDGALGLRVRVHTASSTSSPPGSPPTHRLPKIVQLETTKHVYLPWKSNEANRKALFLQ